MNLPIGVYRPDDAREIHSRVLGPTATQEALDNTRDKTVHNFLYYALLLEDLTAATNPLTGYTQADIRVIRYVQPGDGVTLNMEESTTTTGIVKVTNRFESFSASAGDLLLVIRHGSEWSPVNSGGRRHQVIFETDLAAAVNTKRDPSTATARILRRKTDGDLTSSCDSITVTNRFMNISIDSGTYAKVEYIDGEWQPYAADCPGGSLSIDDSCSGSV
jgi:hypothetical protein